MGEILKKLTTRNLLAVATAGVLLWTVFMVISEPTKYFTQITELAESLPDKTSAIAIGGVGGLIVGSFLAISKDVYQFFFRTSGPPT